MSVSRTSVLSMVSWLSAGLADQTVCTRLYDEVLRELAHDPRAWCTNYEVQNTGTIADTANTKALELRVSSLGMGKLLALFFNGRQLSEVSRQELSAMSQHWYDEIGEPIAYTRDDEDNAVVRIYPRPRRLDTTGESVGSLRDSFAAIYTDVSSAAIPDELLLPVSLLILHREFERESNHRDTAAAEIWKAIGIDLLTKVF